MGIGGCDAGSRRVSFSSWCSQRTGFVKKIGLKTFAGDKLIFCSKVEREDKINHSSLLLIRRISPKCLFGCGWLFQEFC
jgi:hypothetical protein